MVTEDRLRTDNLVTWLEHEALKEATPEQRERWTHNLLPEEELLRAARAEVFKIFEADRWAKIEASEVRHSRTCKRPSTALATDPRVVFSTDDVSELTRESYALFRRLGAEADALRTSHPWFTHGGCTVKIELRTHWAECTRCGGEAFRSSASVRIMWAGRELVREYAL